MGKNRKPLTFSSRATNSKFLVLEKKKAYQLAKPKCIMQFVKQVVFHYFRKYVQFYSSKDLKNKTRCPCFTLALTKTFLGLTCYRWEGKKIQNLKLYFPLTKSLPPDK